MVEERTNEPEDGQAPVFTELSARRLGPVRRFFVRRPAVMDVLVLLGFAAWAGAASIEATRSSPRTTARRRRLGTRAERIDPA